MKQKMSGWTCIRKSAAFYINSRFLSAGKGDLQDHAILLCSLFLGLSLEAYVTLGMTKDNSLGVWVTTLDPLVFWDPISGLSYDQTSAKLPFRNVGCCFNNSAFYANVQVADSAAESHFEFGDETCWKSMSADAIAGCRGRASPFPFRDLESVVSGDEIRDAIRMRVKAYRADHGLGMEEDPELASLCPQLLERSELEKVYGGKIGGGDWFSAGVRRVIPIGHTFKGYPMSFGGAGIDEMFAEMKRRAGCRDVLLVKGDVVRFGVCVRRMEYIEGVSGVWVMICARYRA
jgi:centrosomal protein CEP76